MSDGEFTPTAEELAFLRQRRDEAANPKPIFTRAQISDPKFFQENKAAILLAAREGRLVNKAPSDAKATFTREQIADPKFFAEHRAEVMAATREGRVVEADTSWRIGFRPAPEQQ